MMERLEIVRIMESDFPAGIPEDIGRKPLEVVNEKGETVALFYNIAFMKHKPKELKEFIRYHDGIFHLMDTWSDTDPNPFDDETEEEWEERIETAWQELEKGPEYNWEQFDRITHDFESIPAICRLAYPYHLENYEELMEFFNDFWDPIIRDIDHILQLADFNVYKKVFEIQYKILKWSIIDEGFEIVVEFFPEWIYANPDFFFNLYNKPEYLIDKVAGSAHVELMAFLLDYKNKYFPDDGNASTSHEL